jgi:hypothetical protein
MGIIIARSLQCGNHYNGMTWQTDVATASRRKTMPRNDDNKYVLKVQKPPIFKNLQITDFKRFII